MHVRELSKQLYTAIGLKAPCRMMRSHCCPYCPCSAPCCCTRRPLPLQPLPPAPGAPVLLAEGVHPADQSEEARCEKSGCMICCRLRAARHSERPGLGQAALATRQAQTPASGPIAVGHSHFLLATLLALGQPAGIKGAAAPKELIGDTAQRIGGQQRQELVLFKCWRQAAARPNSHRLFLPTAILADAAAAGVGGQRAVLRHGAKADGGKGPSPVPGPAPRLARCCNS